MTNKHTCNYQQNSCLSFRFHERGFNRKVRFSLSSDLHVHHQDDYDRIDLKSQSCRRLASRLHCACHHSMQSLGANNSSLSPNYVFGSLKSHCRPCGFVYEPTSKGNLWIHQVGPTKVPSYRTTSSTSVMMCRWIGYYFSLTWLIFTFSLQWPCMHIQFHSNTIHQPRPRQIIVDRSLLEMMQVINEKTKRALLKIQGVHINIQALVSLLRICKTVLLISNLSEKLG